jgi:metal-responsive CopG/Arc/MetJ family transcriptional regulator
MRKKLLENDKKPKISITIDKNLDNILEEHLKLNKLSRSKYIENLIRQDFEKKGENIEREF